MKRNPHIIVQQVCPMKKTDDGKYEVQAAIVHHKGIIARYRMEYPHETACPVGAAPYLHSEKCFTPPLF